jgi:hypothetical protein
MPHRFLDRLSRIEVTAGAALQRAYDFKYQPSSASARSLLGEVTPRDASGAELFPPHTFDWLAEAVDAPTGKPFTSHLITGQSAEARIDETVVEGGTLARFETNPWEIQIGDYDCDGLHDMVRIYTGAVNILQPTAQKRFYAHYYEGCGEDCTTSSLRESGVIVDLWDADGLDEAWTSGTVT